MATTLTVTCGCGCGLVLAPGMYGYFVAGKWFAQGCIGIVRPIVLGRADTYGAIPT